METLKKRYIVLIVIITLCAVIAVAFISFSDNIAFRKVGEIVLIVGMAVTSMGLYFDKDSTKKMIFKSLIYIAILGILTLFFREKLAELNLFMAFVVLGAIGMSINAADKLIIKVRSGK